MKKPICGLAAVIAMMAWTTLSHALPNDRGDYQKLGVGNLECGLWTQARESGDVNAVWWKTLILGWVQGFLSAYNLYGTATVDITKGSGVEDVAEWVDTYCVQHPHSNIAVAAEALVINFRKPYKDRVPPSSPK